MEEDFEKAMVEEFEAIQQILLDRRSALIKSFSPTQKNMGRAFALGSVDAQVWRLLRRAKGEAGLDG